MRAGRNGEGRWQPIALACHCDILRDVWPIGTGPTTNICGRVEISVRFVTASGTPKDRLRRTILLIDMMALRTFPTGVTGVHGNNRDSRKPGFVLNKLPELKERPRTKRCSVFAPNRDPLGYALQVLQGDTSTGAFSASNYSFTDAMVNVCGEAPFLASQISEFALCASRLFLLEFGSESAVTVTNVLDATPAEVVAIRIGCNIGHSKVYPKPFVNGLQGWLCNITGDSQKPLAPMVDEIGFALLRTQQFDLPGSADVRDGLPTLQRPNTHSGILEAKNAVVVGDSASLSEFPFSLLVEFVGVGDLGKDSDRKLGAESVSLPRLVVKRLLKGEVLEHFSLPGFMAQPVRAFVGAVNGGQ